MAWLSKCIQFPFILKPNKIINHYQSQSTQPTHTKKKQSIRKRIIHTVTERHFTTQTHTHPPARGIPSGWVRTTPSQVRNLLLPAHTTSRRPRTKLPKFPARSIVTFSPMFPHDKTCETTHKEHACPQSHRTDACNREHWLDKSSRRRALRLAECWAGRRNSRASLINYSALGRIDLPAQFVAPSRALARPKPLNRSDI